MQSVIYDVAVSLDGFIAGPNGDVSAFAHDGEIVADYVDRLSGYATAIMGRNTYEFGYAHGLAPGANPYPHMKTFVFSSALHLPEDSQVSVVAEDWIEIIRDLKVKSSGPIYLCGGGAFAGWLLKNRLIDTLILKRAPVIYGSGTSLFGGRPVTTLLKRAGTKSYENGYLLEQFRVGLG